MNLLLLGLEFYKGSLVAKHRGLQTFSVKDPRVNILGFADVLATQLLLYSSSQHSYEVASIIIPIFQVKGLRHKEVKQIVQGRTAGKW